VDLERVLSYRVLIQDIHKKYDSNNPNQLLVIFEFILDQQLATRHFADISELSAYKYR
jgi:hypothetical protein